MDASSPQSNILTPYLQHFIFIFFLYFPQSTYNDLKYHILYFSCRLPVCLLSPLTQHKSKSGEQGCSLTALSPMPKTVPNKYFWMME